MHTRPPTPNPRRLAGLSIQRQLLVRLCQQTNYGSIRGLEIRQREPVFDPPPVVQVDLKLDSDDPPRPEMILCDFALSQEVVRLLERLDEGNTTLIELLEVRAGIPRRVVFRAAIAGTSLARPAPGRHADAIGAPVPAEGQP
jgi:hypothetical protein